MAEVKILIEGYFKNISRTRCRAGSTIVLIQDEGKNILVGVSFWGDERIKLLEKDCANKKLFYKNRRRILKIADFIIPGHGKMFKVKK